MAGSMIALLMSLQAPALIPDAPPVAQPAKAPPPGMAYDPITGTTIPIVGLRPNPGLPAAGTRLKYNRLGQKIGEAPIRH
jgi:hypothetical protein